MHAAPGADTVGFAPYTEPLTARDFSDINATYDIKGGNFCNSRPGLLSRQPKKEKIKPGPKSRKKHTRCPGCGGMVIAPCILCNPGAAYDARLDSESSDDD